MMRKIFITGTWIFTISLVLNIYPALSQSFEGVQPEHQGLVEGRPVTRGPERGTLLLIGGNASDSLFLPMFQELVGGPGEPVVIIPTARSDAGMQDDHFMKRQKERFAGYGFTEVHILHTRDREEANSEAFVQPIRDAPGVWFMGGRQWRLSDSYLHTRVHRELERLLDRGGVIAGSSAGATIQGSYLVRGDTRSNTIMMGDHEKGLSFIENIAVDQHLLARNRHFDMFEVLRERPGLLGIGLDENTGIVVEKDTFRVVGEHYVAIYDGTRWSAERDTVYQLSEGQEQFYFLHKGQRYDMKQRKVLR
ncbi:MAG: cyanophycinase [Bacteroidales bacterium]|nr:cyanophycinase [Bacteroidales bacterium]